MKLNGELVFTWVRSERGAEGCQCQARTTLGQYVDAMAAERNFHLEPEDEPYPGRELEIRQVAPVEDVEPTVEELNELDRQEDEEERRREEQGSES